MYDEKKVADSLRACKEMKTFYQTGVFKNPQNAFDLDTFLPAANEECRHPVKERDDEEFQARLQEAMDFGLDLRRQTGRKSAEEIAEEVESSHKPMQPERRSDTDSPLERTSTTENQPKRDLTTHEQPLRQSTADSQSKQPTAAERLDDPYLTREQRKELTKRKKEELAEQKRLEKEERLRERAARNKAKAMDEEDEDEEDVSFAKLLLCRFLELVICVAVAYVLSGLFNHYIGTHTVVDGSSMESSLHDEDVLGVNKIGYRLHDPKRFDIIVFPFDDEEYYIKRIIGLPGETVKIEDGVIYINGEVLEEHYGLEPMEDPFDTYDAVTLGSDEYFVLGDNRNHSKDSRSAEVGLIKKDKIVGKAFFRIYPFDSMGTLD